MSEKKHHTSRGQRKDRAGVVTRRTALRSSGFDLSDEEPGGSRPPCLGEPRGQRTKEQFADVPMVHILDIPVLQMVDQLVAALTHCDFPVPWQVIAVSKISCPSRSSRTVLSEAQTPERLVEVPTVVSRFRLKCLLCLLTFQCESGVPSPHVVSSVLFAHVTFHDGFTPQTNIQHFTKSHMGIGNQLCLRT